MNARLNDTSAPVVNLRSSYEITRDLAHLSVLYCSKTLNEYTDYISAGEYRNVWAHISVYGAIVMTPSEYINFIVPYLLNAIQRVL